MAERSIRRLTVVELGQGVAVPSCGRLFAALGHHVIKFEPPPGDRQRAIGPFTLNGAAPSEASLSFQYLNLAKDGAVADVSTQRGRNAVFDALATADVVLTDSLPAEDEPLGLAPEQLHERFPELVVVSISAFGRTGELRDLRGDSLLAEAYGGLATMVGEPEDRPLALGGRQLEHAAGIAGFLGALAAVGSGGGRTVEVAACDVAAYMDWKSEAILQSGGEIPMRTGSRGRWKMFAAADGIVGLVYQPYQWSLVCDLIGDPLLAEERFATQAGRDAHEDEWVPAVAQWCRQRSKLEIYEAGQRASLPIGYLATIADIVDCDQVKARGFLKEVPHADLGTLLMPAAPFALDGEHWNMSPAPRLTHNGQRSAAGRPTGSEPLAPGHGAGALAGLLVLDLGTITAGAACTRLLADFGARVIKIEARDAPDRLRFWGAEAAGNDGDGVSPFFPPNNAGKEGVALNLKTDRGRELFYELTRRADIVVENFAVGVTQRLGISYSQLRQINPRLIYASLSSHGQTGPFASHKSYGSTLDLLSGLASLTGYDRDRPLWSSFDLNYPDQLVSLFGAAVIVHYAVLGRRDVHIDVSQREVIAWTLGDKIASVAAGGDVPGPSGNARDHAAPSEIYPTNDAGRWIAISCTEDGQRHALAAIVGFDCPDASNRWWRSNASLVDARVAEWSVARTRDEAVRVLLNAGVPCVPVLDARDRADDSRFQDRRVFFAPEPRGVVKNLPFMLSDYALTPGMRAPELGEHTQAVLAEFCGVDEDEYASLVEDGVV